MKIGVARLQNNFHSHTDSLNVGSEEKDKYLLALEREILPSGDTWYEFLVRSDLNYRAKLDLSYAFNGFPAPDCSLDDLFKKASETMLNSNVADSRFFSEFLDYCKSSDLVKALYRYRDKLNYKCMEGYDPADKPWFE